MLPRILQRLLSLRYRVHVTGLDTISSRSSVLIIPNHPAEIDPVLVSIFLWDLLKPRPVVLETMYNLPLLNAFMKKIRAIPMPDMEFDSGPYKRKRIGRALHDVVTRLQHGENILIYPSGRLSVTGEERLGAASGIATILKEYPDVAVCMIRTRGLYGSIFSKALTGGRTPDVATTLKQGITILLQNLLILAPRREVSIEIVFNPSDLPRSGEPLILNRFLERFYNTPSPEKATLIPYHFFSRTPPSLPEKSAGELTDVEIPDNIRAKVYAHVARVGSIDVTSLSPETLLGDDLGLDSLTIAELLLWLDREFEAHDIELSELTTVGSLLKAATGQLGSHVSRHDFEVPPSWNSHIENRPTPVLASSTSIGHAFLHLCSVMGNLPAMGDERSGVITWSELKLRALILAKKFSELPGTHVGLLFPASVGGSLATIAAILGGKIPVLLNWTAGKRALLHAVESTSIQAIVTSQSFLDIVPTDLDFLESKFLFIEELRKQLTLKEKMTGKRLARESAPQLIEALGLQRVSPDAPAVVLFTSGSEALPKGVSLTHRNILSNISGILDAFPLGHDETLLGFLPTFHSFGLTVCTILPLVTGLRVAYHPNPNESRKIARSIAKWSATVMAGTPTFLRSILKAGAPDDYETIRTLISGAERAPQELFDTAASINPRIQILEGYGITECAPVVSLTRPGEPKVGVGKPLLGTEISIVHPETFEHIPEGRDGLILISSPSVFPGYIDPTLNPFVELFGKRFYNSGDIGRLENGSLIITGRLKRFIKIAGEMVSLTAVEEALQKQIQSPDGSPTVAVLSKGSEGDSRPLLILFTSEKVTVDAANTILKEAGFPHLIAIARVQTVSPLPLLGSGKLDYQELKRTLHELEDAMEVRANQ
jgi:long-chain-fatty-acid--[acyl-carrier-protein] ligase